MTNRAEKWQLSAVEIIEFIVLERERVHPVTLSGSSCREFLMELYSEDKLNAVNSKLHLASSKLSNRVPV